MPLKKKLSFQYEFWDKVYLSSGGVKRHVAKRTHFPKLMKLYLQIFWIRFSPHKSN